MAASSLPLGYRLLEYLERFTPGLKRLVRYQRGDFPHDLMAGLSVAAVALPVGIAYAELAGFSPVVGLYASILPLVAYALFGTSRQLIVGPDAATCALVAAAVSPLAGHDQALYLSLSVTLTFLTGLVCIAGSFLRLGALADFLSKPILIGFLNGVALTILLGQIDRLFGFSMETGGIVPRLIEFASKVESTHLPTLAVAAGTFVVMAISRRLAPRLPAALMAMVAAGLAVRVLGLEASGVATVGEVPSGLPPLRIPSVPLSLLDDLLAAAGGLALVSFTSMSLTARSFASRGGYDLDADREFAALGAANLASALSQGFAISGADSRTAMGEAAGGRTQVTGLIAAAAIAAVLLLFTGPLRYVPVPALGAVLVTAALALIDLGAMRFLLRLDRREFTLSVLAMLGVVAIGAIKAILFVVVLAVLRFIQLTARPRVEVLGTLQGEPGFHSIERHPGAVTMPGAVILRFNGPLVFFNAGHFKRSVLAAASDAGPDLKWFVIDLLPVTLIDATGVYTAQETFASLRARGVTVVMAGRKAELLDWAARRGWRAQDLPVIVFPTLRQAIKAFRAQAGEPVEDEPPDLKPDNV